MVAANAAKFEGGQSPEKEEFEELDMEDLELIEDGHEADVSHEASEAKAERRLEWQKMEIVRGEVDDFNEGQLVQFEMRKDLDKRKGDTPGEDMFIVDRETGISGVLDGLGGEGAGDKASTVAADTIPKAYLKAKSRLEAAKKDPKLMAELLGGFLDGQTALLPADERQGKKQEWVDRKLSGSVIIEAMALVESAKAAHEAVKEETKYTVKAEDGTEKVKNGNTTLTLGKTVETSSGDRYEVIVNSGDSGAFLVKEDGTVENLTQEDSAVDLFVAKGFITREQSQDPNFVFNGKPIKKWRASMFQAVGMDEKRVDSPFSPRISVTKLEPGDRVVYLTDGIRDLEGMQTNGRFDPKKAAKFFEGAKPSDNIANLLNEAAAQEEASLEIEWQAMEGPRKEKEWDAELDLAEKEGRDPDTSKMPDFSKKPKRDEKTVLVKEILESAEGLEVMDDEETIELDESDIIEEAA